MEFLSAVRPMFEVIIFTASEKHYADCVLDILDPNNDLIDHRLYRESCISMGNMYIKDLRILQNRRLSSVVLVDNLAQSFAFQLNNGIPIVSWYNDRNDRELE